MRIGIIIGRTGGVDGVSLEAQKWQGVLRRMGHSVFVLAGEFEGRSPDPDTEDLFPPLSFYGPECAYEQKQAFFGGEATASELHATLDANAAAIADTIVAWAQRRRLDLLVPENAGTLPFHLSMGIGLARAVALLQLPVIAHHHDFAWDRPARYTSHHESINELVAATFPLRGDHVSHAVINSAARAELALRFGAAAVVVPNVMDFLSPFALPDDYNATVRRDLGVDEEDVLLFQVTRVIRRKSIETAIDLVHRLGDPKIKLVITGSPTDDPGGAYVSELKQRVGTFGLGKRVLFAHQLFANARTVRAGNRVYSLEDAYTAADACTFFSTYEGFGNAFLEAVLARRPVFVNNYRPVFNDDIAPLGFQTVMLEESVLTDDAVAAIAGILADPSQGRAMAEANFALGKEHFSLETLAARLQTLLDNHHPH